MVFRIICWQSFQRRNYVDDYKLNLITPDEIDDFAKFTSELGFVLEFIHNSDDKYGLRDIIKARENKNVGIRTIDMINTYTGAHIPTNNAKGGQVKVCQGLMDLMEEERDAGADKLARLLKAIKPGSKDFDKALNATSTERKKLYKKYGIID